MQYESICPECNGDRIFTTHDGYYVCGDCGNCEVEMVSNELNYK